MTENTILAGNFVFVSYCHADKDIVQEDVKILHSHGVRVWFDENMHVGDNWKDVAAKRLAHPNCKGIIFYISKSTFLSNAIDWEQKEYLALQASGAVLKSWAISIDGKPISDVFFDAANGAPQEKRPALKNTMHFFDEVFSDQDKDIDDNIIVMRNQPNYIEKIIQDIARPNRLVDDVGLATNVMSKLCNGFGSYIDKEHHTPLKSGEKSERFSHKDVDYILKNNRVYTLRPLKWTVLYVKDDVAVLLCNESVADCCGGDAINDFLAEFELLAFTEAEHVLLGSVPRLLTPDDIAHLNEQHIPPLSSLDPLHSHWWINDKGLLDNWQSTYCNDKPYKTGFVISVKKGVRPVIEIPMKNFKN